MQNEAKIRENSEKLNRFVYDKFIAKDLDNNSLVELMQLCGDLLNIKTPSAYAKANGLTYQGVVKCRQIEQIFGVKFVVDNL